MQRGRKRFKKNQVQVYFEGIVSCNIVSGEESPEKLKGGKDWEGEGQEERGLKNSRHIVFGMRKEWCTLFLCWISLK